MFSTHLRFLSSSLLLFPLVRECSLEQKENPAHLQSLGSEVSDIKVTPVTCVLAPGTSETSESTGDLNTFSP
ncbi:hypothetical protein KOW79_014053 [Hemibagrus wyckioides]|uniref:Uncharacterized protein n=1 Tax=Hemibagrus wyckioides TaxID=337641 RepID=A0A9D3NI34_9TELE|nr:hypothetical protein KOW79_014053 [Hemibagrus wyckioides]